MSTASTSINEKQQPSFFISIKIYNGITQCYRSWLHWLLVWRRVDFKMATLVYLPLSGMAPAYLATDCQLVSDEGRRQLSSATSRTCAVRQTYSIYGDRCFAAAGPKLWNSLPTDLQQADISFQQIKRVLKTFLFGCWDRGTLWLTVKAAPHEFSYLPTYSLPATTRLL